MPLNTNKDFSVTKRIDPNGWSKYFRRLAHSPTLIQIEVLEPTLGDQKETDWAPLEGMSFDEKRNVIDIATENLDHRVINPAALFTKERSGRVECIEILDSEGRRQLIRFKGAKKAKKETAKTCGP